MQYYLDYASPIGMLRIFAEEGFLCGLNFELSRYPYCSDAKPLENPMEIFAQTTQWLDAYFSGNKPSFLPPMKLCGSDFAKSVWQELLDIPYGSTTTYKSIAGNIALKRGISAMSAQAVGGAVGHNPIGIIIPCHRVISENNNLTGFGGGIENKIKLLQLEGVDTEKLKMPVTRIK